MGGFETTKIRYAWILYENLHIEPKPKHCRINKSQEKTYLGEAVVERDAAVVGGFVLAVELVVLSQEKEKKAF